MSASAKNWRLRNDTSEVGPKVAEALANSLSNEEAFDRAINAIRTTRGAKAQRMLAKILFGSEDFAEVARLATPPLLNEIRKIQGDLPKGATEAAKAWKKSFDDLKTAATGARDSLAMETGLLGGLTGVVKGFQEFALNKDPETGFSNIQTWAGEANRAVRTLWGAINEVAEALAGAAKGVEGFIKQDRPKSPAQVLRDMKRERELEGEISDREERIQYNRANRLTGAVPPAEFDRRNEELTEELKKLREELEQLRTGGPGAGGGTRGGLGGVGGGIRDAVKGIFGGGGGAASGIGGGMGGIGPAARVGGGGSTASIGHAAPWKEREAYIRQEARKRGLNPDDMVAIAKTEGAGKYSGDFMGGQYRSFGDFQLYTGGGEGNRFAKATGLDPRNPKTWREQTQFSLNRIVELQHTNPWNGPKNAGIAGRINANIAAAARRGDLRKLPIVTGSSEGSGASSEEGRVLGKDRNGNPIRLHNLPPRGEGDELLRKARGSPFQVNGNADVNITIDTVTGRVAKTKTSVDGLFKDVTVNKGKQMQMAE